MVLRPDISNEDLLAKAIDALGTDVFPKFLYNWLQRSFEADNATILAYFQTRRPEILFCHSRLQSVHDCLESIYLPGAYLLDPFHELHVQRVTEGVYRLRDIAPDQFHRNEYFASYYKRTTLVDELAFIAYPAEGVSVHICLGRDASSDRTFSSREVESAQKLSKVVGALVRKQWAGLSSQGDYTEADVVDKVIRDLKQQTGIALSRRQAQVALLVLRGHSSVSIGLRLGVSPQTVKVFRKQLYRKCEISSQAELLSLLLPVLSG